MIMGLFSLDIGDTVESAIESAQCNIRLFKEEGFKLDHLIDMAIKNLQDAKIRMNDNPNPITTGD